jgi:hypothetical protein
MGNESWWEKNRKIVQFGVDLLIAVITGLVAWGSKSGYLASLISAFLAFLFTHTIFNIIEFNALYPDMRRRIHSTLGCLRDVAAFLDEAHQLNSGKKGISISFAIRSLNSLTQKGFLEVDVPYHDFLDYIKALTRETKHRVFGTSTIRRPKELANDPFSKSYLKALLDIPNRTLARVTVLDERDVLAIVDDALRNLKQSSGHKREPPAYDIPEIQWWTAWANQISYKQPMKPNTRYNDTRILLWTTHSIAIREIDDNCLVQSTLRPGTIDDYALFDDTVVVKFRENKEVKKGILFLLWGNTRVGQYALSFTRIETALQPGPSLALEDLGFFDSFYELLKNIKPTPTIDISEFKTINGHFGKRVVPLDQVYFKILELVNNGEAKFVPKYEQPFS